MVGDQSMEVGSGAVANQAKRDINYYGLSLAEVERMVTLLNDANFPKLLADAMEKVDQRLDNFSKQLFKTLEEQKEEIDAQRFAEPNIQFQLQQMAKAAAQKGEKSNFELLCDVFLLNLRKDTSDLTELVANEALELLPKLSTRHIEFLALYVFVRKVSLTGGGFELVEKLSQALLEHVGDTINITERDRTYMAGVGAFQMSNISHMEMLPELVKQLPEAKGMSDDKLRKYLEENNLSSLLEITSFANISRVTRCVISEAGIMIGWISLSKIIPVDLSVIFKGN